MILVFWILRVVGALVFVIGCAWLRQLLGKDAVIATLLIILGLAIQFIAAPGRKPSLPTG